MKLVERLRAEKDYRVDGFTPVSTTNPLCADAADRIEELEDALLRIQHLMQFPDRNDVAFYIAREALRGAE